LIAYSYGYDFAGTDDSQHEDALDTIKGADLAVLTLGGKYGTGGISSMGEGIDATDINLPVCQETFIAKAAELGKPLIALHFNGRPISSDNADKFCGAVLECWSPAEKGAEAIVDVLLGGYTPCGRLPVSVACNAGQVPVYYGHYNGSAWHQGESIGFADYVDAPHRPRYPFGHGLSYTEFEYAGLRLNKRAFAPDETVRISADIKNCGTVGGTEIVQFYFSDKFASMTRPNMELAEFVRVELSPDETKTVELAFDLNKTAFLDEHMKWKVEAGEFEIMLGASSADIRLRDSFTVTADRYIRP
jgi:beta-glucosidase